MWQRFFEQNPWVLGAGLGGQLFTSWDGNWLEQVVIGASIAHAGKRADAVMRTSGVIRWMTFAEIKTHKTPLLGPRYRRGVWPPSSDLTGGVSQSQVTVNRAIRAIGEEIRATGEDGSELPDDTTYLTRPRSYLVIGHLEQLLGEQGGAHTEKICSFELFRRHLIEPEVVTFDELLARAEWMVALGEEQADAHNEDNESADLGSIAEGAQGRHQLAHCFSLAHESSNLVQGVRGTACDRCA